MSWLDVLGEHGGAARRRKHTREASGSYFCNDGQGQYLNIEIVAIKYNNNTSTVKNWLYLPVATLEGFDMDTVKFRAVSRSHHSVTNTACGL